MKWACMCNVDHQNVEAKHVSCRKNWYFWYRTCGKTKPFRIVSTTWTTCGSVANNIQQLLINLLLEFWQEELFGGWASWATYPSLSWWTLISLSMSFFNSIAVVSAASNSHVGCPVRPFRILHVDDAMARGSRGRERYWACLSHSKNDKQNNHFPPQKNPHQPTSCVFL